MTSVKTGQIVICGGGTGVVGGRSACARLETMRVKPLMTTIVVDTDVNSERSAEQFADEFVDISIPFELIGTYLAEPQKLSPIAAQILEEHKSEFNSGSLGAGAGTRRYITQFMFELRGHLIFKALADAIVRLRAQGATSIQIHIVGSNGGGTGSALAMLLPYALGDPCTRSYLMMGCEGLQLMPPILHLADVTCHIKRSGFPQNRNIRINSLFTSCYVGNMLRESAPNNEPYITYVTMTGTGNDTKFLETIDDVEAELGASLAMQLLFHHDIRAREVDALFHSHRLYSGDSGITKN